MCMYNSNEFNFIQLVTSVDEVESTWKASSDLTTRSITEYMPDNVVWSTDNSTGPKK